MLYRDLATERSTDDPVLWIAGCSISHGVGVDRSQRYGQLIANRLDLRAHFLTYPGTSIEWASDQLLRSDIRDSDTVIWGLTHISRFSYYDDKGQLCAVTPHYYEINSGFDRRVPPQRLLDRDLAYQSCLAVVRVQRYLERLGCPTRYLRLWPDHSDLGKIFREELGDFPGLCCCFDPENPPSTWRDLGTDLQHPGPDQHRIFSEYTLASFG